MRLIRLFALLVMALACLPLADAAADPYPVTNTNDSGEGSLRAAIVAANAHTGADTIPIETTGTINLQSALQVVFSPVAIIGPGAGQLEVRRSAAADFSIFGFSTDAAPSSLSGLTISNGSAAPSGGFVVGGGIRNSEGSLTLTRVVLKGNQAVAEGGANPTAEGAGIYSEGPLTLRETVVTENVTRASNGSVLTKALGGGVAALASLTVEASTISGNTAEAEGSGTAVTAQGGGLLAGTDVAISRSTISGNSADAQGGAGQVRAQGGGAQIYEGSLIVSTLSGNSAVSAGVAQGANLESVVSTLVRGTLLANALGDASSCSGTIFSGGFNLDENNSCGFDQGSDLVEVAAGLDPVLRDNGGPTPTHALLAGSIAIDRGNSFGSGIDQRGLPRPSDFPAISNKEGGDGSDIGAFELQVPPAAPGGGAPVVVSERPTDRSAPQTRIVSGPPRNTFKTKAKFRFASSEGQSGFECKLDRKKWKACSNPFKATVKPVRHLFKVRAVDRFGNTDPTPAQFGWRVRRISG